MDGYVYLASTWDLADSYVWQFLSHTKTANLVEYLIFEIPMDKLDPNLLEFDPREKTNWWNKEGTPISYQYKGIIAPEHLKI